jgi:hypothetical protein
MSGKINSKRYIDIQIEKRFGYFTCGGSLTSSVMRVF